MDQKARELLIKSGNIKPAFVYNWESHMGKTARKKAAKKQKLEQQRIGK